MATGDGLIRRISEALQAAVDVIPGRAELLKAGRELGWIVAGHFFAVTGSLLGVRVLTGVLDPRLYGRLAIAMTLVTAAQQMVTGPIGNAGLRFLPAARDEGRVPEYLGAVKRLEGYATVLMLLVGGVAALVAGEWVGGEWPKLLLATSLFAVLTGYNAILDAMQNASRQRAIVAWHNGLGSWLRYLSAAGAVLVLGAGATEAMTGYCFAFVLILLSQGRFFPRAVPAEERSGEPDKDDVGEWQERMTEYFWPFSAWGIFTWSQLAADRWALEIFSGSHEVGLYAALYQIGFAPALVFTGVVNDLIAPILFQKVGSGRDEAEVEEARKLNLLLTAVTVAVLMVPLTVLVLAHQEIFGLLVAEEYRGVSRLAPLLFFGASLYTTGQVISIRFFSEFQSRRILGPKIVTAVAGVVFHFAGAYWLGVEGVVLSNVAFGVFFLGWLGWMAVGLD